MRGAWRLLNTYTISVACVRPEVRRARLHRRLVREGVEERLPADLRLRLGEEAHVPRHHVALRGGVGAAEAVCSSLLKPTITSTGFCLPFANVIERSSGMIAAVDDRLAAADVARLVRRSRAQLGERRRAAAAARRRRRCRVAPAGAASARLGHRRRAGAPGRRAAPAATAASAAAAAGKRRASACASGRIVAHAETHPGAALGDRALEQPLRDRRAGQHADDGRAGRFAEDRDVVRIAAEARRCWPSPTCSAAMASASAWLPDALRPDSFVSSGCEKKPNAPRR